MNGGLFIFFAFMALAVFANFLREELRDVARRQSTATRVVVRRGGGSGSRDSDHAA